MFTILLVEDQAMSRETLAALLRHEGFRVLPAQHGREGLDILEHQKVDLVLFDLFMPKMGGVAMLEAIRADARFSSLPAIVFTGSMDSSQIAQVAELNVQEIFSKARFSIEELLARLHQCLPVAA
jgi:CheY-like chemotaxis protein